MVRRGMTVVLASAIWIIGVFVIYERIEASAMVRTDMGQKELELIPFQFPFLIPGTDLVALELRSYEGLSIEDGSMEGVSNVAALVLRNDGDKLLETARVELWQGEEKLNFELSYLPGGEKILVLESSRKQYRSIDISACTGYETIAVNNIGNFISFRQIGENLLLITNTGPLPLKNLVVYFKNYDYERAMFLGGIIYEIPIYSLAPGETFFTEPAYYNAASSRIVKIKTSG